MSEKPLILIWKFYRKFARSMDLFLQLSQSNNISWTLIQTVTNAHIRNSTNEQINRKIYLSFGRSNDTDNAFAY